VTWTLEGGERMDIIRAWKDEGYRNSLSEAERAALPPNPAGLMTLTNEELGAVAGGRINPTRSICRDLDCTISPSGHCI
jgi:mersacidin/lichenicidin family type 2 lantibiotic